MVGTARPTVLAYLMPIPAAFWLGMPPGRVVRLSTPLHRSWALSFPETIEEPHFEKTSFRVRKKIFATYDDKNNSAALKLKEADQDFFSSLAKGVIYPVKNKWGAQGWTIIELEKTDKDLFEDILERAYCAVAPDKLAEIVRPG